MGCFFWERIDSPVAKGSAWLQYMLVVCWLYVGCCVSKWRKVFKEQAQLMIYIRRKKYVSMQSSFFANFPEVWA